MLEGKNLAFRYRPDRPWLFQDLDLSVGPGEVVGLPGPSGRGKSTLARVLAGYLQPNQGHVLADGRPLPKQGYCPVQILFQHPELAVNPRWTVRQILGETGEAPPDLMERMAIDPAWLDRYPHELSGGELQRVCLVRALGSGTRYLLCDEMTSMLDALTQAHIWQAALEIVRARDIGLLVVSHDRPLIDRLCHRMAGAFEETSI